MYSRIMCPTSGWDNTQIIPTPGVPASGCASAVSPGLPGHRVGGIAGDTGAPQGLKENDHLRFSCTRRPTPDSAEKPLPRHLRELEQRGIVAPTVGSATAPHVEYAPTPRGSRSGRRRPAKTRRNR
ncbi:winged helix-turn-helix transcriptional regulator [Streptomyces niveus]|uniref:winged helix-turn-helix transcriptional regulator n=1 Tax=Streptomyces niveus TaxID=193462 RepID=UPI00362E040B